MSRAEMRVDYDVAMEVACHEALIRQAYKDSVGVLTWCVGMTSATGHSVDRYIGKPASLQHCMNLYAWALTKYAEQVIEVFNDHPLTKAQFAAAVSFHWNTGAIKRASWVKHFKAGNMAAAKKAFMSWVKPPEIKGRREKERDLLFDGKWSNDGTMTEFTRLTSKMTPVWASAKRVNVSKELKAAFSKVEAPVLDAAPQPDKKPAAPTLTPSDGVPAPAPIPTPKPAPESTVGRTDTVTVRVVQERLKELGYSEVGKPDGIMGKLTRTAILAFKNENDLHPINDVIDQAFLDALDTAPPRMLPRETVSPEVVRKNAPEVKTNWVIKIGALITAAVSAAGGFVDGIIDNLGFARETIKPMKEMFSDIPSEVWLIGVAVIAGGAYLVARQGEQKGIEAYQAGERR